jgi:hypothetical protein
MAKAPTHIAPSSKPRSVTLTAGPQGGFLVHAARDDYEFKGAAAAAFTTLDEALDWLRDNMARPAAAKPT